MQGLSSYMPGGSGADPIAAQANRGFEQQTLPSIMEALGTGVKSSSGLNQTMGAAGSDLQSQLAALRSQMGLQAAGQGMQAGMQGAGESQFAYMPRQMPFWQKASLGGMDLAGNILGAWAGAPGAGSGAFSGAGNRAQRPQTGQMYSPKYGYMPAD